MTLVRLATAAVVVAAAGLALAGCSSSSPSTPTAAPTTAASTAGSFVVTGELIIDDRNTVQANCDTPGVTRILDQDSVVVYDSADKQVATGTVGAGKVVDRTCVFPFAVEQVPTGSTLYSLEFADGEYRGYTFTQSEAKNPITVTLELS